MRRAGGLYFKNKGNFALAGEKAQSASDAAAAKLREAGDSLKKVAESTSTKGQEVISTASETATDVKDWVVKEYTAAVEYITPEKEKKD